MDRPKFVPIGYCKGWSEEKNEWISGWHWSHLTQAGKDSHITHYIRIQKLRIRLIKFFLFNVAPAIL